MAVMYDYVLDELRLKDVVLVSLASGSVLPDPLIVNNLQVTATASINNLYLNNAYISTATIGNLTTNNISNHSTISTNYLYANAIYASTASIGFGTFDRVIASTATISTAHISNIEWNLVSGATIIQEGQMNWDTVTETVNLGMAGGNVDVALGMEQLFPKRVRNSTGSTMPKGTVVYINGVSGNTPTVDRAIATSDMTSAFTLGMTAENINDSSTGWVTTFGELTGLNLSSFTGGDTLYLSGATLGAFTNVPQSAPIHYVRVGTVVKATADGALVVNVINGYELQELHNVVITSLASGQIIQSGASSYWYNRSLASAVADFIVFPTLPSLGSLAVQNTVDYLTQITNLPSLGSLAILNDLSFLSLTNQPSLSSLAFQSTIDYTSAQLTNKPSLGSLAQISNVVSPLDLSGATLSLSQASIVHNNLGGLTTGDPHTQYALLAGRSGGQTLHGGTVANDLLILRGTSATGNTATNNAVRFGVGNSGGTFVLDVRHNGTILQTANSTAVGSPDVIGANFNLTDSGGGGKTIFSHRAKLTYSGVTSITGVQATSNQIFVGGGGTVIAAEILTSNLEVTNNSTVVDAKLIRLFAPTVNTGGSIGTLMGLNIPALTQGTTNWSIYSEGGAMYHSGNINIGDGYLKANSNNAYISPQTVATGDILSGDTTGVFQFDASNGNQYLQRSSADAVPPIMFFYKSRGATNALGAITAGDTVGRFSFHAYTGALVFDEVSRIVADTVVGADAGALRFSTAPDRTTGVVERLTILPTGEVVVANYLSVNNNNLTPIAAGAVGDILAGNANANFQYDASTADLILEKSIGNAQGVDLEFYKSRGNTASPSIVTAGDDIGLIRAYAFQASAYAEVTRITFETVTATNSGVIRFSTANAGTIGEKFTIMNDGDVGIGVAAPAQKLDVNGRIRMATWTADGDTVAYRDTVTNCIALVTSDIRLKKDLEVIPNALDKIKGLSGYKYRRIDDEENAKKKYGLIAQEILEVAPELTFEFNNEDDPNTYYSVHYDKVPALLLQAIKEQQVIIESLKQDVEILKGQING